MELVELEPIKRLSMTILEQLYVAVKKHSGMTDEQIKEAGKHGADTGWPGFTYNQDTVKFYNKNEEAIYELLYDEAKDLGEPNIDAMVSKFSRQDMLSSPDGRKTLLSWFVLEQVGRALEDGSIG